MLFNTTHTCGILGGHAWQQAFHAAVLWMTLVWLLHLDAIVDAAVVAADARLSRHAAAGVQC